MIDTKIRAYLEPHGFSGPFVNIAVVSVTPDGKCFMAEPVVMKEVPQGVQFSPVARIHRTAAQQLMDDLWQCGLRPSEGTGSAGAMAATQEHLKDMRKIAFGLLGDKIVMPSGER